MIKHFSVLYMGTIELDNVGRDGTAPEQRRYGNDRLIEALDTATQVAKLMDELGYYALWTAEHHFQVEGYECIPNLILLGTHLASKTERLKFGCAFNVVPTWHPLRLAEDFAMADVLTGGADHLWGGQRLPDPRGGELRGADTGQRREPGAVPGADGDHLQGVPGGVVFA